MGSTIQKGGAYSEEGDHFRKYGTVYRSIFCLSIFNIEIFNVILCNLYQDIFSFFFFKVVRTAIFFFAISVI